MKRGDLQASDRMVVALLVIAIIFSVFSIILTIGLGMDDSVSMEETSQKAGASSGNIGLVVISSSNVTAGGEESE